jgi:hypothetical protein
MDSGLMSFSRPVMVAGMPVNAINNSMVNEMADRMRDLATDGVTVDELRERRHLEPVARSVLNQRFPDLAEKDRKVAIPGWERIGNVDVLVREAAMIDRFTILAELKWCAPKQDIIWHAIWDLFKMALGAGRAEQPRAYLITGAEQDIRAASPFADLFEDAVHDPEELCGRRLNDTKQTIAWDELLWGGYESCPEAVPERITTNVVGRGQIGPWKLRAVEVFPATEGAVGMTGGWPGGKRPPDASHPPLRPASRVVDKEDDIQIDPGHSPETSG